MKQSVSVGASPLTITGREAGKKFLSNSSQGILQTSGHQPDGLGKYFQVLPLVEGFLKENDPQLKKRNGIFFTPYPVVLFIVRSIHTILKESLGKPLGLADESVKILDPATGTGTFLITLAQMAIDEITRKYGKRKAQDFARQYLLNNLFGIEKEFSLYAIARLKLAHFFQSQNLQLYANEQFQLYWADALGNGTGNVRFNVTGKVPVK